MNKLNLINSPQTVLETVFGHKEFRYPQKEIIESLLKGQDTVAFASTGFGKSSTYQIPALCLEGVALIISPLKALQKDQVDACLQKGIKAAVINSDLGKKAREAVKKSILDKSLKLLYVAPETLLSENFQDIISLLSNVSFIAVDEAHCCFRKDVEVETSYGRTSFQFLHNMFLNSSKLPLIKSYNVQTKQIEWKQILNVYENPFEEMQTITFKEKVGKIESTCNHIYFTERGQIAAKDLIPGDKIISLTSTVTVESSLVAKNQKQESLYDIEVADNHNYFVYTKNTQTSVLVHNCSEWSDFRPDYTKIHQVRGLFPEAPVLAVTATADAAVYKDIIKNVGLKKDHKLFTTSFDRPYLHLNTLKCKKAESFRLAASLIRKHHLNDSGIVYCFSKKRAEEMTEFLKAVGFKAACYHASVKKKEKELIQEQFLSNDINIIVATVAFGMGIDHPTVRFVIHADAPDSFESYFQQVGRLSRDRKAGYAYLLYDSSSLNNSQFLIQKSIKNPARLKIKLHKLRQFHKYCSDTTKCKRIDLLKYFGEDHPGSCEACSVCKHQTII